MGVEALQAVQQEDDIMSQVCLRWFPPIEQSWHNLVSLSRASNFKP